MNIKRGNLFVLVLCLFLLLSLSFSFVYATDGFVIKRNLNVTSVQAQTYCDSSGNNCMSLSCSSGQVLKNNGFNWVCSNDLTGSGSEEDPVFISQNLSIWNAINNRANISNLNNYVPYTGATGNVALGGNNITASNICYANGTNCSVMGSGTFVPYTGATSDVNLNGKNLTNVSYIQTSLSNVSNLEEALQLGQGSTVLGSGSYISFPTSTVEGYDIKMGVFRSASGIGDFFINTTSNFVSTERLRFNGSSGTWFFPAGIKAGTGNVTIIDGTGKIPALTSTYIANLNGSSLTSLNAPSLVGIVPKDSISTTPAYYEMDSYLPNNGIMHETLSAPTIGEIGAINAYMNNKIQFQRPIYVEARNSTTGEWNRTNAFSDTQLDCMVAGIYSGACITLNKSSDGYDAWRFIYNSTNYVYLNWFYTYMTSNGHSTNITIERTVGADLSNWTSVVEPTSTYATGWPGHITIGHSVIPFSPTTVITTQARQVRVTFQVKYSSTYNTTGPAINNMAWYGFYPASAFGDNSQLTSWDKNKNYFITGAVTNVSIGTATSFAKLGVRTGTDGSGNNTAFELQRTSTETIFSVKDNGNTYIKGNVGIGTSAPDKHLVVSALNPVIKTSSSSGTGYSVFQAENAGGVFNIARESSVGGTLVSGSTAYAGIISAAGTYPIQFAVNNAIGMTMLTGGNVGIGTTAPVSQLEVFKSDSTATLGNANGAITLRNPETVNAVGSRGYTGIDFAGGNTTDSGTYGGIYGVVTGSGASGQVGSILFGTKSSIADTSLTERMRITNTGNVGIGTTAPVRTLSVNGSFTAGNATDGLTVEAGAGVVNVFGTDIGGSSYNDVSIRAGATGTGLYLKTDGNVGIGTNAPTRTLEVAGTIAAVRGGLSYDLQLGNTASGGIFQFIGKNGVSYSYNFDNQLGNYLSVKSNKAGAGDFVIDADGKVGIGTTAPTSKLDVNGTANFAGNITAPNICYADGTNCSASADGTKLNITDQRYNETSLINSVNSTVNSLVSSNTTTNSRVDQLNTTVSDLVSSNTTTNARIDSFNSSGGSARIDALNTSVIALTSSNTTTNSRIDDLNTTKLNITDQRYNETALINSVNSSVSNLVPYTGATSALNLNNQNLTDVSYLGVGTSSPSEKLEVNGNAKLTGTNPSLLFYTNENGYNASPAKIIVGATSNDWPFGFLKIQTHTAGSNFTDDFIIKGGNVGIGTTSPNSKLDVNGTASFTGNLSVTNITNTVVQSYQNSSGVNVWRTYVDGSGALVTEYIG